jgi:hypothetical protein
MGEKGSHAEFERADHATGENGWAHLRALWIVDRWRRQGFDTVTLAPSGYCSPLNQSVMRSGMPEGYRVVDINSEEAVAVVESSIVSGITYRF